MIRPVDAALIAGATARLTRLVTTDKIGDRYLREPAERWALDAPEHSHSRSWRVFLVDGLGCPHCVGFWIGVSVSASYVLAARSPRLLAVWRFGAGVLSLNTAVGHVSARID